MFALNEIDILVELVDVVHIFHELVFTPYKN